MSEAETNWKELHKDLGCRGCRWADKKAVGRSGCCQAMDLSLTTLVALTKSGKKDPCVDREEG